MRSRLHSSASIPALAGLILLQAVAAKAQTASGDDSVQLDAVEVSAERTDGKRAEGYVVRRTSAGTKTDAAIETTPISISVVDSAQIEAQGSQTVQEALRYEVGVISDARPGGRYDSIFMRGFGGFGGNANYVQFWDGLRLFKGLNYAVPSIDPYLLQSIAIVRGPMSTIYGQTNPGGSIDLVSKWPDANAKNEVFTGVGTYGEVEGGVDLNGKLTPDGSLLYRFIGIGRRTNTEVDGSEGQRVLLAPMLTWQPNADTRIQFQATYQRDPESYYSTWLPALGTLQSNPNGQFPRSFSPSESSFTGFDRTQWSVGYRIEHDVNDTWTLRQNLRYLELDTEFNALSVPAGGSAWASAAACNGIAYRCLALSPSRYVEHLEGVALDNQAEAKFATGPFQHTVLFGVDLQRYDARSRYGTGSSVYVDYLSPTWPDITTPTLTTQQTTSRLQLGGYAQDQITFGNWHALIGVREDYLNADTDTTVLSSGKRTGFTNEDSAFTYRAGLLYEFENGVAPYVSYATSFDPVVGTGYGGVPFEPTTAQQFEAGVKYQPRNFPGLFTLSYFDLTQQNVLTTDTAHTSTDTSVTLCSSATCQTQIGEVNSRGIEVSGKAEVLPGLNLMLAYAYTDAEVTKSNVTGVQGKVPVGVPEHSGSAWADYTWRTGALAGLTLGGGARYVGETFGDQTNTEAMKVGGRVLFDAALHYDFGGTPGGDDGWRFSLTATNLADKYYVSACASANQCFVGTGRAVLATLAYRW